MCDMAHYAGLVAAKVAKDPFQFCHIVTTTTHKTLRGPRAGMIFFRKQQDLKLVDKINFSVFPQLQGGPHNNVIAAIAVQMAEVDTPAYYEYAKQVKANAKALAEALISKGHKLVTNGTDNHLILWDLRPHGVTGNKFETLSDLCSITLNKNAVYGDGSALSPGGARVGTPALTSRGFVEKDFVKVADFLHRALEIAVDANGSSSKSGTDKKMSLDEFKAAVADASLPFAKRIATLRGDVEDFAKRFAIPGFVATPMPTTK